jgi:hypothetical protein
MTNKQVYLHLISGPRNISTALMYSFAQRTDTIVEDEPFYACYLAKTNANHPGKAEVLQAQSANEEEVKRVVFSERQKPVVFIKNMAHHIEVLNDDSFLDKCVTIFLIRDPKQIIASYAQVIEQPVLRDIGIEYELRLFNKLGKQNTIVIDSGLLLKNPESVLTKVCERASIPFDKRMLSWSAGPKPYDGVWAPYWYSNVHQSSGFEKQESSERPLPDALKPLLTEANTYYQELVQYAITP